MDRPGPAVSSPSDTSEPFEDHIGILFEELAFAIRWRRPSILLVFYETQDVRAAAALALEKRLTQRRHPVIPFGISEQAFDVPLALSRRPDRRKAVYFVSGLAQGGGREGANAYRALNMRRELFVDYRVRLVLWVREAEAVELSRHAPDFWAFRHRVVELGSPPDAGTIEALLGDRSERDWSGRRWDDYLDERIALREQLLGDAGGHELTPPMRIRLLSSLAGLHRTRGDSPQALRLLQQSAELASRLGRPGLQAWHWGHLGLIQADLGEMDAARQACEKAVGLQPQDSGVWDCLGEARLAAGEIEAALEAFGEAAQVDSQDARSRYGLGRACQQAGRLEESLAALRKAVRLDSRHAGAWEQLGALYLQLSRPDDALKACKKAVRLAPRDADSWEGLGQACFSLNAIPDAIIAYRNAAANNPENPVFHATLATLHRLAGQDSLAEEQIGIARSCPGHESDYERAVLEAVCGNADRALELLGKVLPGRQGGGCPASFEPAFGSLRSDPRFAALIRKA
jgi:tetratricopeptide (TPR) repeat protein